MSFSRISVNPLITVCVREEFAATAPIIPAMRAAVINTTTDDLVGKVDNDNNGRATVISQIQGVGDSMREEGKLIACAVNLRHGKVDSKGVRRLMFLGIAQNAVLGIVPADILTGIKYQHIGGRRGAALFHYAEIGGKADVKRFYKRRDRRRGQCSKRGNAGDCTAGGKGV